MPVGKKDSSEVDESERPLRRSRRASSVQPEVAASPSRPRRSSNVTDQVSKKAAKNAKAVDVELTPRRLTRRSSVDRSPSPGRKAAASNLNSIPEGEAEQKSVSTPSRKSTRGRTSIATPAPSTPTRVTRRSIALLAAEDESAPASPSRVSTRRSVGRVETAPNKEPDPPSRLEKVSEDIEDVGPPMEKSSASEATSASRPQSPHLSGRSTPSASPDRHVNCHKSTPSPLHGGKGVIWRTSSSPSRSSPQTTPIKARSSVNSPKNIENGVTPKRTSLGRSSPLVSRDRVRECHSPLTIDSTPAEKEGSTVVNGKPDILSENAATAKALGATSVKTPVKVDDEKNVREAAVPQQSPDQNSSSAGSADSSSQVTSSRPRTEQGVDQNEGSVALEAQDATIEDMDSASGRKASLRRRSSNIADESFPSLNASSIAEDGFDEGDRSLVVTDEIVLGFGGEVLSSPHVGSLESSKRKEDLNATQKDLDAVSSDCLDDSSNPKELTPTRRSPRFATEASPAQSPETPSASTRQTSNQNVSQVTPAKGSPHNLSTPKQKLSLATKKSPRAATEALAGATPLLSASDKISDQNASRDTADDLSSDHLAVDCPKPKELTSTRKSPRVSSGVKSPAVTSSAESLDKNASLETLRMNNDEVDETAQNSDSQKETSRFLPNENSSGASEEVADSPVPNTSSGPVDSSEVTEESSTTEKDTLNLNLTTSEEPIVSEKEPKEPPTVKNNLGQESPKGSEAIKGASPLVDTQSHSKASNSTPTRSNSSSKNKLKTDGKALEIEQEVVLAQITVASSSPKIGTPQSKIPVARTLSGGSLKKTPIEKGSRIPRLSLRGSGSTPPADGTRSPMAGVSGSPKLNDENMQEVARREKRKSSENEEDSVCQEISPVKKSKVVKNSGEDSVELTADDANDVVKTGAELMPSTPLAANASPKVGHSESDDNELENPDSVLSEDLEFILGEEEVVEDSDQRADGEAVQLEPSEVAAAEDDKKDSVEGGSRTLVKADQGSADEAGPSCTEKAGLDSAEEIHHSYDDALKSSAEEACLSLELADQSSAEKAPQSSAEEAGQSSIEEAVQSSAEEVVQSSAEEAVQSSAEEAVQRSAEEAVQSSTEETVLSSAEVAGQCSAENVRQSSDEEASQSSAEEASQSPAEGADRSSAEDADQSSAEDGGQSSAEEIDHSMGKGEDHSSTEEAGLGSADEANVHSESHSEETEESDADDEERQTDLADLLHSFVEDEEDDEWIPDEPDIDDTIIDGTESSDSDEEVLAPSNVQKSDSDSNTSETFNVADFFDLEAEEGEEEWRPEQNPSSDSESTESESSDDDDSTDDDVTDDDNSASEFCHDDLGTLVKIEAPAVEPKKNVTSKANAGRSSKNRSATSSGSRSSDDSPTRVLNSSGSRPVFVVEPLILDKKEAKKQTPAAYTSSSASGFVVDEIVSQPKPGPSKLSQKKPTPPKKQTSANDKSSQAPKKRSLTETEPASCSKKRKDEAALPPKEIGKESLPTGHHLLLCNIPSVATEAELRVAMRNAGAAKGLLQIRRWSTKGKFVNAWVSYSSSENMLRAEQCTFAVKNHPLYFVPCSNEQDSASTENQTPVENRERSPKKSKKSPKKWIFAFIKNLPEGTTVDEIVTGFKTQHVDLGKFESFKLKTGSNRKVFAKIGFSNQEDLQRAMTASKNVRILGKRITMKAVDQL